MTDQEIVQGIAQKDSRTFVYLYRQNKQKVHHLIEKNSGNAEDAMDVFQEAVITLWINIKKNKFELREDTKLSTYLIAICKNIWLSRLRTQRKLHTVQDSTLEIADDVEDMRERHNQIEQLENSFGKLSTNCRHLLKLFYHQKLSLSEIAGRFTITEATAKNNKYRCMQKLREIHLNDSQQ